MYRDFDLKLSANSTREFFVEVLLSPQSVRTNPVRLQIPEEEITSWKRQLAGRLVSQKLTLTLGRHLFEALFPREILRLWEASKNSVDPVQQLRLRLDIRSPELAVVPWELIHDGLGYIAMSGRIPLVRCLYDHPVIAPGKNTLPLNVLVIVSTPRDTPPLPNIERELVLIEAGIASLKRKGKVGRFDVIRNVTRQSLQQQLCKGEYQVLHYMGHGQFNGDNGYLVFENENGFLERVTGETISYLVTNTPLRLLFLNSCETAISSPTESFLGVAEAALAAGLPAVVAMQDVVQDEVAARFAQQFYQTLAEGQPLEFCMVEGRKAIHGEMTADWAIPVLFSNVSEGLLWKPEHDSIGRIDKINESKTASPSHLMLFHQQGDHNKAAHTINETHYYAHPGPKTKKGKRTC